MVNQSTGLRWRSAHLTTLLFAMLTWVGCGDDEKADIIDPGPQREGCVECHTDQVRLEALAIPDDPPGEGGAGEG